MTDLSTIVAAERSINITHPATGEPVGLTITLLPDSHPQVKAAERKALNERLNDRNKPTAEKLEAQRTASVVARVDGWEWSNDLNFHGEQPEFSTAKLREVLAELPWVRDQIEQELGNRSEFFRGAGAASE